MRTDTLDCTCAAWLPSGNNRNGEARPYSFNSHNCSDLIQETFKCWSGQAKSPCELFDESKTPLGSLESRGTCSIFLSEDNFPCSVRLLCVSKLIFSGNFIGYLKEKIMVNIKTTVEVILGQI